MGEHTVYVDAHAELRGEAINAIMAFAKKEFNVSVDTEHVLTDSRSCGHS